MRFTFPAFPFVLLGAMNLLGQAQVGIPIETPAGKQILGFGQTFFKSIKTRPQLHWVEKYKDSNSGEIDEYHIAIHQGFRVHFIRSKSYPADELCSLTILSPSIRLPLGVKLGASPDQVKKIFGPPSKENRELLEYDDGMPIPRVFSFRFTRDRLIEIELSYDHD